MGDGNGNIRIVIIGFGNVGRSLAKILSFKKPVLEKKYGIYLSVVGVVDSKGMIIKENGLSSYELLKLCELPRSGIRTYGENAYDYVDLDLLYKITQPDIHVELTPSNYETGEPGLSNLLFALNRGVNVVTANKAPLVLGYEEIMNLAKAKGVYVKFRATVMGGTPLIDMLLNIRSPEIEEIRGILNATTNFVLTTMHNELIDFDEALQKAKILGIAEADPRLDVEGYDAAAKLVILSRILGKPVSMDKIKRDSLSKVKLRDVINAMRNNHVIKYIAYIDLKNGYAEVKPFELPRSEILSQVNGTLNAVEIYSDIGKLFFMGKGGGGFETAHSVLDDILSISIARRGLM
ncbi:MAG: hypothetical protein QXP02_01000 [Desulfurococcaceae archaeon]